MPYIHGMSGRFGMLVEYPTSLEREMQTKKSHEISDSQWGQTPYLQEWIDGAIAERAREQSAAQVRKELEKAHKQTFPTTHDIFKSLKPTNSDFGKVFEKAKHQVLSDIGVNGNVIVAGLSKGDLVIEFNDPDIIIEPHEDGMIANYHEFEIHTLTDLTSYIPTSRGLQSCIFCFVCNNKTFEYLIQPTTSTLTLAFQLTYQERGE